MEIEKDEQAIEKTNKKLQLSSFLILFGSILLVLTLFMPFASAKDDYKERLENNANEKYSEELNMTNKEVINLSLLEYGKVYYGIYNMGINKEVCLVSFCTIAVLGVFIILTLIFSILKRPIAIMICSSLSLITFRILKWDFMDRNVVPSKFYDLGIATYFCYIGIIITVISAIILLIIKVREKNKSCGG